MSNQNCGTCDKTIATLDDTIICSGPCGFSLHLKCAGLSKAQSKLLVDCSNIHYYCNNCQKYSNKTIADRLDTFTSSINGLVDSLKPLANINFSAIVSGLSSFSLNSTNQAQINTVQPNSSIIVNNKRRRIESPVTNNSQIEAKTGTNDSLALAVVPQRKSIVASQLSSATTTEQILKYIADKLNITDAAEKNTIRPTILLPANKKAEELNFVSFRVSMPETLFETLFSEQFWPKGVIIREYIPKPKRNFDIRQAVFLPTTTTTPQAEH